MNFETRFLSALKACFTLGRRWRLTVLLAQVGLLAACGPGVGGTGTGLSVAADALQAFGAQAISACLPGASSSPACTAASGLGSPTVQPPTVVWLDTAPGARVRLDVQGDGAALEKRCTKERFIGQWATSPNLGARYYGIFGLEGASGVAASLSVRSAEPSTLTLELRGLDDNLLLPPLTVQRYDAPLPAPVCP
jgi:hypothetical protein